MSSINFATREISCKVVYYGPGLSGKTTNLQVIHQKMPQDKRTDMVSLATDGDRTLFFDFLPLIQCKLNSVEVGKRINIANAQEEDLQQFKYIDDQSKNEKGGYILGVGTPSQIADNRIVFSVSFPLSSLPFFCFHLFIRTKLKNGYHIIDTFSAFQRLCSAKPSRRHRICPSARLFPSGFYRNRSAG